MAESEITQAARAIASLILCESDRRWGRLTDQQRQVWLTNAYAGDKFDECVKAARAGYTAGLERAAKEANRHFKKWDRRAFVDGASIASDISKGIRSLIPKEGGNG